MTFSFHLQRDGSFSSTSSSSKRKRGKGYGSELSIALSESTKKMHEMMESIVGKIAETPKKDNQTDQILASRFEEVKRLREMAEMRMFFIDESGGEDNPRVKILKNSKTKVGKLYTRSCFCLLLNLNQISTNMNHSITFTYI